MIDFDTFQVQISKRISTIERQIRELFLRLPGGLVTVETQSVDIFRCDSPGGASSFSGTINGAPVGATLVYNIGAGNEGAMKPNSNTQLGKIRLYNTTLSAGADYLLIDDCNVGTNTLTFTANVPATWLNGHAITIASQTVIGGGFGWIDIQIASVLTGKAALLLSMIYLDATAGNRMILHPFEAYSVSKFKNLFCENGGVLNEGMRPVKVTGDVFSLCWNGAPTAVVLREDGSVA